MERIVSLDTLGNGAAMERFEVELAKVLTNIADPNTKADAVREITLKVKIKPSDKRNHCAMEIITSSKLAPYSSVATTGYIGRRGDELKLVEQNPEQLEFDGKSTIEPLTAPTTIVASNAGGAK